MDNVKKLNVRLLLIHIIILFFLFGFKYLPPFGQMTPYGMGILGIFLGELLGWLTIGFIFPSIAGIFALAFSGTFDGISQCFAISFGNDATVMILCCLFVCAFMEHMKLTDATVGFLLNLRLAKKSSLFFFFIFFFAVWLVSALSSSVLSIYLTVMIYRSISRQSGIEPYTPFNSFVLCGCAMAAMMGEISFPFKPVAVVVMNLYQTSTGSQLPFETYLYTVTLYEVVLLFVYALFGKYILRLDYNIIKNVDIPSPSLDKRQKYGLLCITLMMVAFLLTGTNIEIFKYMGLGGAGLASILVMLILQVDGEPLLDIKKMAGKFDWGTFLYMAFFVSFMPLMGSPEVGLNATASSLMAPILSIMPSYAFLALALLLTTVLTNILNNLPVAIIFISLMGAMSSVLTGINFHAGCLCITICAFIACATPAANPASVIIFGCTDLIRPRVSLLIGGIACLFLCIVTLLVFYPFLNAIL
ncbi:MAG TPA: hypothetical protein H9768_11275 [Candidatus Mailhella merdavium]|nr:hypothetical protein [Candidatus Mailhella merdavium]